MEETVDGFEFRCRRRQKQPGAIWTRRQGRVAAANGGMERTNAFSVVKGQNSRRFGIERQSEAPRLVFEPRVLHGGRFPPVAPTIICHASPRPRWRRFSAAPQIVYDVRSALRSIALPNGITMTVMHGTERLTSKVPLRIWAHRLARAAAVALMLAGLGVHAAHGQSPTTTPVGGAGITIPNAWDPNRRLDRPPAGSIASIRFTTTDDFPPFNFMGTDGQLKGFNVDLARAICSELGVPCTIQSRPWDGLIDTVAAGRVDAAIAGIAVTPENRARLDFSDVYLRAVGRFLARRGTAPPAINPGALSGKIVAVAKGSSHEAYLQAFFPKSRFLLTDSAEAAREALKTSKADLAFGDGVQSAFWLQSAAAADCCGLVGGPYIEPRFFGPGLAIALPPGHPELRHAFDWALDSLYDRGIFAELYLRYFPVGYF